MPEYRYIAMTPGGERVAGVISAASEQAVLADLDGRKLTPLSVAEQASGLVMKSRSRRLKTRQLATAYTQLADLLRAGVPLLRSLRLLAGRTSAPTIAQTFKELSEKVAEGSDLAEAMSKSGASGSGSGSFPRSHVAMVRAGERGGSLEAVLTRLGQFLMNQADMRSKIVISMLYPAALVVIGVVVLIGVFAVLIPKFKPIYSKLEEAGRLPALTRVVLRAGDVCSNYWYLLLMMVVAAVGGAVYVAKSPSMRAQWDSLSIRMPVVGRLRRDISVATFCRTLGTMLQNSIPMLTALQIARDAAALAPMEAAIDRATEAVRQGQPLAPPLGESGLIDADVVEMISVGEAANNLDDVLVTVADTLERRLDRSLTAAMKLVEPVMLVLIAGIIGMVAIGLIVPMSQLSQGIGR